MNTRDQINQRIDLIQALGDLLAGCDTDKVLDVSIRKAGENIARLVVELDELLSEGKFSARN